MIDRLSPAPIGQCHHLKAALDQVFYLVVAATQRLLCPALCLQRSRLIEFPVG
jgi:hypothetical protein